MAACRLTLAAVWRASSRKALAGAESGEHDDRVMALMIAIQMYNRVPLQTTDSNPIARSTEDMTSPYKVTHATPNQMSGNEIAATPGLGMEEYF